MLNTGFWGWAREIELDREIARAVDRIAEDVGELNEFDYQQPAESLEVL